METVMSVVYGIIAICMLVMFLANEAMRGGKK